MRRLKGISGYSGHRTSRYIVWGLLCLVAGAALLLSAQRSWAAPFAKTFHFTQPDNTKITIWGEGDEFRAIFETTDGYTIIFDPQSKAYYYAKTSEEGSLVSTGVPAHHPPPPKLAKHIRPDPAKAAEEARARRERWDEETGLSKRWRRLKSKRLGSQPPPSGGQIQPAPPSRTPSGGQIQPAPPSSTTLGAKVGLTLLIDFPDAPATISKSDVEAFLNGDSYTGFGNNGSIKEYFSDVSGSRLTYTNVVTAYIRMNQPKSYYDDVGRDCGDQGRLLITDAMAIFKARSDYTSTILPTLAGLTTDESDYVVALNVFFAGEDSGTWNYGLWPHSFILAAPIPLGNGKSLYAYQITNQGAALQLGTFCHENAHMLCDFPDVYDYDYDSSGGAGAFCLMNSGGGGTNPSRVNPYLKLAAGWGTVTDLDSSSSLTGTLVAAPSSGHDMVYRFRRPGVTEEYFLLENRQKTGRDANIPAAGIAIWHVDELGDHDNQSLIPNDLHQNYEVTLVQADNAWHFQNDVNSGDASDLYFQGNGASSYSGEFSDSSFPNANWWDGSPSGVRLNNFGASGMSMTFNAGSGSSVDPAPVLTAEPPVTPGTANTISWSGAASALSSGLPAAGAESGAAQLTASAADAATNSSLSGDAATNVSTSGNYTPAHATVPRMSRMAASGVPALSGFAPGTVGLLNENFEAEFPGSNWSVTGTPAWDDTGYDRHGGSKSVWCGGSALSPESNYADNMDTWMIYGPFSLAGATGASLNFWYKNQSEEDYDYFGWYASVNGEDFYGVETSGDQNSWRQAQFDLGKVDTLGNLAGREQVWIGFNFTSDMSISAPYKGAFVDDIAITKTVDMPVEYFVESAENPDFTSPTVSGWITQTQWTRTGLSLGTTYWYRVKARTGTEETGWSNVEHSLQEDLPTISGTASASVIAGSAYSFVPTATRAARFEIVNRPSWASFNAATGALTGTPTLADVNSYPNIIITATNGAGAASLSPFTITVQKPVTRLLTVTVTGSGGGSVTISPPGVTCVDDATCMVEFLEGSNAALAATPDSNSTFGGWSGACQGRSACSVPMTGNRSVTASFSAAPNILVGGVSYQTLQGACTAAGAGATIQARAIQYPEQLIISHRLRLRGGYNAAFSSNAGGYTTITGSMKIRQGPVTVERVVIR